jgi:hypothetical protein
MYKFVERGDIFIRVSCWNKCAVNHVYCGESHVTFYNKFLAKYYTIEGSIFQYKNLSSPQIVPSVMRTFARTRLNPTWTLHFGTCKGELERALYGTLWSINSLYCYTMSLGLDLMCKLALRKSTCMLLGYHSIVGYYEERGYKYSFT